MVILVSGQTFLLGPYPALTRPERGTTTCLAWEGLTETHRHRYTGQQPGTKSACGPADQLRINRGSTAGQLQVNSGFCFAVDFLALPCMKNVYKDRNASLHGSAAKWKERIFYLKR